MFSPDTPNPAAGGLLGATIYEGDGPGACNCRFVDTNSMSFGPRVGVSYQIDAEDRAARRLGHHLRANRQRRSPTAARRWAPAGGIRSTSNRRHSANRARSCATGSVYNRDDVVRGEQRRRHPAVAGTGRFAAAVDSSRRRQDAEAEPVERLGAARDHARSRRRRGLCRQSRRRVYGEQHGEPECHQRRSADVVRARRQQRRRSHAADLAHRFGARGPARVQQAAVCQLLGREHRGAEPAAVPAVRHDQCARRAARREQVRLAAGESDQALLERPEHGTATFTWQNERTNMVQTATTATPNTSLPTTSSIIPKMCSSRRNCRSR